MPISIQSGKSGDEFNTSTPLTQKVRIGGVVQELIVSDGTDIDLEDELTVGLDSVDTYGDIQTGIGREFAAKGLLPQHDEYAGVDLHSFRKGNSDRIYDIINQAIEELIDNEPDCFFDGWEGDEEFVMAIIDVILEDFDFKHDDILEAINRRA